MTDAHKGVVLHILGAAGGQATPDYNRYVASCDVDAFDGRGLLDTVEKPEDAMVFPDVVSALEYWRRQSTVTPLRPDGEPNRPLTAYHVEVVWI